MMMSPATHEETAFGRNTTMESRVMRDVTSAENAQLLESAQSRLCGPLHDAEKAEESDISVCEEALSLDSTQFDASECETQTSDFSSFVQELKTRGQQDSADKGDRSGKERSKSPLSMVEVKKTSNGFGFNIVGGVDNPHFPGDPGIFISLVNTNSMAYGVVRTGDKILSINGVDLTGRTHDEAVEQFRGMAIGKVARMLIDRDAARVQKTASEASLQCRSPNATNVGSTNTPTVFGGSFKGKSAFDRRASLKSDNGSIAASDSRGRLTPHGVATVVERLRDRRVRTANGSVMGDDEDEQSVTSYAPSMHSIIDDVPRTPRRPLSLLDPRNNSVFTEVLYVSIGLAVITLGGFAIYRFVRSRK